METASISELPQESLGLTGGRRRQRPRLVRTRRARLIGAGVLALAAAAVVAIPLWGWYSRVGAPLGEPLAIVNDTVITVDRYVKRLRYYILTMTGSGMQPDYAQVPFELVFGLQEEEIVRQGAPREGVFASKAEIDKELQRRILGRPVAPGDAQAESAYREQLAAFLSRYKLPEGEYRRIIEGEILRAKLGQAFSDRLPTVAKQSHVHVIQFAERGRSDELEQVYALLYEGDQPVDDVDFAFAFAAQHYSVHASRNADGDAGYIPLGLLPPAVRSQVEGLALGELSQAAQTSDGIWIVRLDAHDPVDQIRELLPEQRAELGRRQVEDWISEVRRGDDFDVRLTNWNSDTYAFTIDQARKIFREDTRGQAPQ